MDGNVDPIRVWYNANLEQDQGFQESIEAWFDWLARHDDVFGLGSDADAVAAGYYRQLTQLDARPAGGVIGPDELADVLVFAAYSVYDWVGIGHAYAALIHTGDSSGIKSYYDGVNPGNEGSDNGYAVYLAVECTDANWPRSFSTWRRDNWRTHATAPFLTWKNAWYDAPCLTWPANPGSPVQVTGRGLHSKILLISETRDPATPYSGSLEVRRRFPSASLIEGVGGTSHSASLSGVACTDQAIGAYISDGTVPERLSGNRSDLECPPVPEPEPETTHLATRSSTRQLLRDTLLEAQRFW